MWEMDLHWVARLMAAGHGGQVLVSETTRALLDGVGLHDLGGHRLKALLEPIRLYQLEIDGGAPTTSLLLPRNLSHLAGPVLAAPHFCFGSPDRRSSSPWLDAHLATKEQRSWERPTAPVRQSLRAWLRASALAGCFTSGGGDAVGRHPSVPPCGSYGGATPQPHRGTGACAAVWAPG